MAKVVVSRSLYRRLARVPVVRALVEKTAAKIEGEAKAEAAASADTGAFGRSIRTERQKTDRVVIAEDPAAASIEFGHHTRDGTTYVEGKHILSRAAENAAFYDG